MEAIALAQAAHASASGSSSVGSGSGGGGMSVGYGMGPAGEDAFLRDHLTRHRSYNAEVGGVFGLGWGLGCVIGVG